MNDPPQEQRERSDPFDQISIVPAELSRWVGMLYAGALEPTPWSSLLVALREALHANWVTLILRLPTSTRQALIVNAGPRGVERANDQFSSEYAFAMDSFSGLPDGKVLSVADVLGDADWIASEFYRQFVSPYGIRYMIGADLHTAERVECRLRICRPAEQGEFSAPDRALCQILLPHLRQAISLHANLDSVDSERTLYASAVDNMLVGVVILDQDGVIVKTNSAAGEIFAENDGLSLMSGTVQAADPDENRELTRLIVNALARTGGGTSTLTGATSITRPSGRPKLGVLVRTIPLNDWSEGGRRSTVAVFIRDADRHSKASRELIRRLFELTPAETSLALLLAHGMSLDEAAEELAIRKNTARAHLRAIFSKVGVTRQTTLVHRILSSVAFLA
jgi:DNA-binding CsgD family transcriptional regulator/PAS domain-containing protein